MKSRVCHRGRFVALYSLIGLLTVGGAFGVLAMARGLVVEGAVVSLLGGSTAVFLWRTRDKCYVGISPDGSRLTVSGSILGVRTVELDDPQVHLLKAGQDRHAIPRLRTPSGTVQLVALARIYDAFGGRDASVTRMLQQIETESNR